MKDYHFMVWRPDGRDIFVRTWTHSSPDGFTKGIELWPGDARV